VRTATGLQGGSPPRDRDRPPSGGPIPASDAVGPTSLWRVRDVATYLQIHEKDVYQLAALHGLPCIRFGRRLRFDRGDVFRWVSARKEG